MNEPIVYEKLTQHLILFAKGHYGKTENIMDDLATFMFKWSWTPKSFYTPKVCYELVAEAFTECCSKHDIYIHLKGIFDPYARFYLNHPESLNISEQTESMLGLMGSIKVKEIDKDGNWYDLIELPKVNPKLLIKAPVICEACEHFRKHEEDSFCGLTFQECAKYVPEEVKPL
jgi:hypothetical protein